ncbi:MAG: glycosyltransferase family 39 protein [Chloroflexota bacterium]
MTNLKTLTERITIAHSLLALILLAAGLMRLVNLGKLPLSPAEAEAALAVWQFWQAGEMTIAPTSPAYFLLTLLITPVLGFSDASVRLVPALVGLVLVALPWLLRPQIGTVAALTGSLLLAVSPLATITARTAGGEALALLALLLLVVGLIRYREAGETGWLYPAGFGLALGLTSAPLFYTGLLALVLAVALARLVEPDRERKTKGESVSFPSSVLRPPSIFTLLAFLGLSSGFLLYLPGLGQSAQLLATWLGQFSLSGSLDALFLPLMALVRYELPLIVLGLVAMLWLIWQDRPLASYAIYWLMGLLVLLLLQRGELSNVPVLLLPGYLLVGTLVGDRLSVMGKRYSVSSEQYAVDGRLLALVSGSMFLLGLIVVVQVARFTRAVAANPEDLLHLWIAVLALAFTLSTFFYFWGLEGKTAVQGSLIALLTLFLLFQWGTAWWLGHEAANDPRERWVTQATQPNTPQLADLIGEISYQIDHSRTGIRIYSMVDNPALQWYLREFEALTIGSPVLPETSYPLVISPAEMEPAFRSDYFGADFLIQYDGTNASIITDPPLLSGLRWWLFRHGPLVSATLPDQPGQIERVTLWVQSDLLAVR